MDVEMFASLVPIRPGEEKKLRAALEALETGDGSPFALAGRTHTARLTVIQRVGARAARRRHLRPALLSFSAMVDGPLQTWLESLPAAFGAGGEAVWSHCVGWPGSEAKAFARWLLGFRLPMHISVIAHPTTSVDEVEDALRKRERLGRLAVLAPALTEDALRNAYHEAFESWAAVPR